MNKQWPHIQILDEEGGASRNMTYVILCLPRKTEYSILSEEFLLKTYTFSFQNDINCQEMDQLPRARWKVTRDNVYIGRAKETETLCSIPHHQICIFIKLF